MIAQLIERMQAAGLDIQAGEVADALWLAEKLRPAPVARPFQRQQDTKAEKKMSAADRPEDKEEQPKLPPSPAATDPNALLIPDRPEQELKNATGVPFPTPLLRALQNGSEVARSLRPLRRRVAARTGLEYDEAATVAGITRAGLEGAWLPVMRPAKERWLELALVVDASESMSIWRPLLAELQQLLARMGVFRDVRTWSLETGSLPVQLLKGTGPTRPLARARHANELIDAAGRRVILLISDCVSQGWHTGAVQRLLARWSKGGAVAILQVLPEGLWSRTALRGSARVDLSGSRAAPALAQLHPVDPNYLDEGIYVPIVNLDPRNLSRWAGVVAGAARSSVPGVVFEEKEVSRKLIAEATPAKRTAEERVRTFRRSTSVRAQELAELLSAAPLYQPVMRLVWQTMLPGATQEHMAEVFLGGIIRRVTPSSVSIDPDEVSYDFFPGVREELRKNLPSRSGLEVLSRVSDFVRQRVGQARDFRALLLDPNSVAQVGAGQDDWDGVFAALGAPFLRRMGGQYAQLADKLEQNAVAVAGNRDYEQRNKFGDRTSKLRNDLNKPLAAVRYRTEVGGMLRGHTGSVTALVVLPDGRVVSGSYDNSVRVWSLESGVAQVLEGHTAPVTALVVLPDGRVVSGSSDESVRVWSLGDGAVQVLEGHSAPVRALAVLADGRVVSGSRDRTVRVWSLESGVAQVLEGHTASVTALTVLADGRVVSGSHDGSVRVWSWRSGLAPMLEGHTSSVNVLAVLPDGRVVSASDDRSVRVWSLGSGSVQVLQGHSASVRALAVLADGRAVSGSRDSTVRVWARSFERQHSFIVDSSVTCLSVISAGVLAAGCADGTVFLLRLPPEGSIADSNSHLLGPEHPDTLTSMSNQAGILHDRGDLEGAQKLREHVVEAPAAIFEDRRTRNAYSWPQALDFEVYMNAKRESFTGRTWLFEEIHAWVASEGGRRALLIKAGPGVGKSAFMSEYVARFRGQQVLAWHFCRHDRADTIRPGEFVRSIAAQVAEAIPEYRQSVESRPELQKALDEAELNAGSALETAVLAPLRELPVPEGARLLVVDALDESLDLRAGAGLVQLLEQTAEYFPPWLRLLATSRPVPEVLVPLQAAFRPHEIFVVASDLNLDDLRQYVLGSAARKGIRERLEADGRGAEYLADLLCGRSGGKFLFVRHALRELADGTLTIAILEEMSLDPMNEPKSFFGVMVSSTYTDVREHRRALIELILVHKLLPIEMEHHGGPRADADVLDSSLEKVRDAAAYICIISHRYGGVPPDADRNPDGLSITELEFNEAVRLNRPILLFLMAKDHAITIDDIELDSDKRAKLEAFRKRAKIWQGGSGVERPYYEFSSLESFRKEAGVAIAKLRNLLESRSFSDR